MANLDDMDVPLLDETDEPTNSSLGVMEDYFEYTLSRHLWIYVSPIILGLGTVGNLLSIVILCRRPIWRLSTSPFFVALAMADMFVLHTGLLRRWLVYVYDIDIRVLSDAGCRIHVFCVYASLHFSAWVLVLVTLSRFLSVCFPLRAKRICSRRKSQASICIAFVLIVLLNAHELIARQFETTYKLGANGTEAMVEVKCGHISPEYNSFFLNVWPWIDMAISSGIPFTAIIVCNSCIVWKVIVSHRFGKRELSRISTAHDKRVSNMTVVLLVLNTVFLVTTAPSRIYLICSPAWHDGASPHTEAVLQLLWAVVNLLMYLNNAVNFILYCVSGYQFRNELKTVVYGYRTQVYPVVRSNVKSFPRKTSDNVSSDRDRRRLALEPYQEWTRY